MKIITDNIAYVKRLLPGVDRWQALDSVKVDQTVRPLVDKLFSTSELSYAEIHTDSSWRYLFATAHAARSQYDTLSELCERGVPLPDHVLCMADYGTGFHGFKNRSWVSLPGNIHLVAYMTPQKELAHVGVGFIVMAVAAVLQTLDTVPGLSGRAGVKWVNDILLDGAKVCGVLASCQMQRARVDGAIVGIGMNVESAPEAVADLFVPRTACLRDFADSDQACRLDRVFYELAAELDAAYRRYCDGGYAELLRIYRERSVIIGKMASVRVDKVDAEPEEMVAGKVLRIGDNLELYLEHHSAPVSSGRLILKN
ncbi:MAG: hypothetical protein JW763_09215 [candidate division Zixibacteria bacterium]|nr:hypothetical protein [candidate division Zixibacteria bacterium]